MRQPQDPTSAIRWLPFLHTEDSVIPPFAVMRVTGYDSDTGYYSVARPNAASMTEVLINGQSAIAPYGEGQGHCSDPCTALYEPNDGTPANGEDWGTASGSWKLAKDNTGFRVLGNAANGTAEFRFLGVAYKELSTTGDLASPWKFVTVDAATTAAVTLADLVAGYSLDGVTLATTQYILVKDQSSQSQNGIYLVSASAPVRVSYWFDATAEDTLSVTAALLGLPGVLVQVNQGTANAGTLWRCNYTPGNTLGTDAVTFTQVKPVPAGGTTGQVLAKQSNTDFDVDWDNAAGLPADPNEHAVLSWDNTDNTFYWASYYGTVLTYDDTNTQWVFDDIVESLVGLASTGLVARTGAGTLAVRTITAGAGVTVTDGDGVSGNPTVAVSVTSAVGGWTKVTVGYASMSAAATSKTILLHTLAAAGDISDVVIKASTVFAGTTTLTADVTVSGNNVITSHDLKAAVSGTNFAAVYRDDSPYLKVWDFGSTTAINLVVTSTGANLDQLTQGSVDVWLKIASLP